MWQLSIHTLFQSLLQSIQRFIPCWPEQSTHHQLPYLTRSKDKPINKEHCCFNQATYSVSRENTKQSHFDNNQAFYIRKLNNIFISHYYIENVTFMYYVIPNFVVYKKLVEIINNWDKSYILIREVPQDYPYQMNLFVVLQGTYRNTKLRKHHHCIQTT